MNGGNKNNGRQTLRAANDSERLKNNDTSEMSERAKTFDFIIYSQ